MHNICFNVQSYSYTIYSISRRYITMLDAFAKVVAQADARGEFLSNTQLDGLSAMVAEANKRFDVVNAINSNASVIVTSAARALFAEQPQLIQPGGNAYTNRRMAACLRDMEIILRYVSYAMIAGDSSVLDDRCLNGLKETYAALGVPASSVAAGIQKMKEAGVSLANDTSNVTVGDCSSLIAELSSYFYRADASIA
jgi:phycocyanin beta chain